MIHALHGLLNNRTLIEILGDIVTGGTDEFYTALMRLVVGGAPLNPGRNE